MCGTYLLLGTYIYVVYTYNFSSFLWGEENNISRYCTMYQVPGTMVRLLPFGEKQAIRNTNTPSSAQRSTGKVFRIVLLVLNNSTTVVL